MMKSHVPVAMTILIGIAAAAFQGRPSLATAQEHSDRQPPSERRQEFEHRSTAAVQEPSGFTAACFASNLDTVTRTLAATIIDWRGNNVTETSSCGANQGPGITCQSTARFTDSALRCGQYEWDNVKASRVAEHVCRTIPVYQPSERNR